MGRNTGLDMGPILDCILDQPRDITDTSETNFLVPLLFFL